MKVPPQITFRNLPASEAVEQDILDKIDDLDKYHDKITSCRVVIESPHHHHHKGYLYQVRIDLRLPGIELVVNTESEKNHAHEDVYVAVRDAFDAMKRQLKKYIHKRRHDVKAHEGLPTGQISNLFNGDGYGFITALDGRNIYFHRNSVIDFDFNKLEVGQSVQFVEEMGEKGPQASTVHIIG